MWTLPPRAGLGPGEKLFSGPVSSADWLKIFMLNWKDCLVAPDELGFI